MNERIEHDSMGEVNVPADRYWGAQTQRSRENFPIGVGIETMPREITCAFGILKEAAARANHNLRPEKMTEAKCAAIAQAASEVAAGKLDDHFPLVVWQTGSGTQSNMNANEVIANRANELAGERLCHPNDDVNMSQSSNDTFPTALHIAAVMSLEDRLLPAAEELIGVFRELEKAHEGVVKSGRTHLQDAVPIAFSQEISGWRASLERDCEMLRLSVRPLYELALGGTAVGTGLNAPAGFAELAAQEIAAMMGVSAAEAALSIIARNGNDASEVNFGMCEEDVERIMQAPFVMIGSDGWAYDLNYPGKPHPRSFGAFPRVLAHYSRERGLFPLETAVYKMTGLPAKRLGLTDRGVLKEGCWADLCIFDPEKIADDPTYLDPCKPCSGISRVYVNGVLTAENGVHTGARAGMVIRK